MRICFSTLGCAERDLDGVLELAKKYNIDALEFRGLGDEMDNSKIVSFYPENREETLTKLKNSGVSPWVLGTSCVFHDETKYNDFIEEGRRSIDIAESLGFHAIRVFGNNIVGDEIECVKRVGEGVRALCEYAADKGVYILLETHGEFNTRERLVAVCEHCKEYENFGLLWDVCHTRVTYGKDWRDFCDEFLTYIRHVHLKDIADGKLVMLGEGELPLYDMVNYLTEKGYDGYFSLEWEKKWHPELPCIEKALDALFNTLNGKE